MVDRAEANSTGAHVALRGTHVVMGGTQAERPPPPERFHDLDALRAFAMLLGVFLHAALFLLPDPKPDNDVPAWPAYHPYAHDTPPVANPYSYVLLLIHGFRMPLFFMLSGFFTAMLWRRRGARALAVHRLKRIVVPLAVGMFTVVPTVALFYPDHLSGFVGWTTAWSRDLYHLWFLLYLLLMAAGFLVLVRLGARFQSRLWWLLLPLVLVPQYAMRETFGVDVPSGFLPMPDAFLYYAFFFLFGAVFHERGTTVRRWWTAGLPVALLLFMPGVALAYPDQIDALSAHVDAAWFQVASAGVQVSFAWLASFGMMGLFRWVAGRERYWVRYMSDASYWIYLWHLPLIIGGQLLATAWQVGPHAAYLLICAAATAVLLAAYQIGVRYTFIGATLNGPRQRRRTQEARRG